MKACTNLTYLNLSRNELSFDEGVAIGAALSGCTALKHLILSDNVDENLGSLSFESQMAPIAEALCACSGLQRLELAGIGVESPQDWLLPSMRNYTALTYLDLKGNKYALWPNAVERLKLAAADMPSLKRILLDR